MNSMLTLALVACFAACAWACCTPDQWEGYEGSSAGYAKFFKKGAVVEHAYVAYDYTNRRSAVFLSYINGDYENKFQIVTRYEEDDNDKERRMYFVDEKKNKCWTKKLEREFHKACIPKDAKEHGSYYLGLKGGFKVRSFDVAKGPIYAFVTVADLDNDLCVPVLEQLSGKLRRISFIQDTQFVDLTPGIKNATVFDVPKQCDEAEETDELFAASVERDHFILGV
ncbi:ependymin-related protein 1 [Aplysia californica]|uniref:Ependymin-related protein 1 n=1 Tax=Aplysia californica TaxID=6500 RepID=A0ABM0JPY6_APLCA|nr:ependymin-related protein 1 [Aplysia californica]XP_012938206.1 ependymin-related protein 1 [Aplysia californica]